MVRPPLSPLVIAGPTGSGKSSLAMNMARRHNGEIICADSRQFYKNMAIGTACPTVEDRAHIPHHGYGVLDPCVDKMHAGFFMQFAREKILEIQKRGKRPILVGGTGFYLRALYYGLHDVPPSDQALQDHYENLELNVLFDQLKSIDPSTAALVKPQDRYRITRALEIFHLTGRPPSELRKSFFTTHPQLHAHWLYKKPEKYQLLLKLELRVRSMFAHGLIEEAQHLRSLLPAGHWAIDVMGYREALLFVDGACSLQDAIDATFIRHRQYAKRQYTWFNKERFYRLVS